MKLTENPEVTDEGPRIEELVGALEEETDRNRWEHVARTVDIAVLAPLRIAWNDWRTRFGIGVVLALLFMASVWTSIYQKAFRNSAPVLIKPFSWEFTQQIFGFSVLGFEFGGVTVWKYPLGTNFYGQDLLRLIVNASPAMVKLILAGSVVSVAIAVLVGSVAGYKGGNVDDMLMGLTDIVLTIPGLPLVILLAAVFEPRDPFILGMILAIDNWPGLARALRSQILTIRNESYVEASRSMGISTPGILRRDVLPQILPYILINAAIAGKSVITEAVGLYFLNFLQVSSGNWGRLMDRAYQNGAITNLDHFYLILWPMLALAMVSFGLILLSQGMDKVVNPRLRARHAKTTEDEGTALESRT